MCWFSSSMMHADEFDTKKQRNKNKSLAHYEQNTTPPTRLTEAAHLRLFLHRLNTGGSTQVAWAQKGLTLPSDLIDFG